MTSELKDGTRKTTFRFPIDFDLRVNEEWEDFTSDSDDDRHDGSDLRGMKIRSDTARTFSYEERLLPAKVINQTPPDSGSGDDPLKREFKFSYADIHLPIGHGDEPLPHSVPIIGLRSPGRTTARSPAARCQSAREPSKLQSSGLLRSSSARGSTRVTSAAGSSRMLSAGNSTRPLSARTSAESRSAKTASKSPSTKASSRSGRASRPYRAFGKSRKTSNSNALDDPSQSSSGSSSSVSARITNRSGGGRNDLPVPVFPTSMNNRVGVKRTWSYGDEAPGYWESLANSDEVHLGNTGVWALTDPPEPPPGIYWKEVTPPASPPPQPVCGKPGAVIEQIENEGANGEKKEDEEEEKDVSSVSSAIIPELVPSADPVQPVVRVIRKVVVMPSPAQKAYPGFCDSSEALQTMKSRKGASKEGVGFKNKQLGKEKQDNKKEKPSTKVSKGHAADVKARVSDNCKKSGIITPSTWKTGLKWAKKELGPRKSHSTGSNLNNENLKGEKSLQDNLNEIHKFVNETENKISEYKLHENTEPERETAAPEIHIFPKELNKSTNSQEIKSDGGQDMNKVDVKALSSLSDKDTLTHIISKEDNIEIDKRNYLQNKDEVRTSPMKTFSELENLQELGKGRCLQAKSAHNLNNAFAMDDKRKIPKKSYSLFNFSKKSDMKSLADVPIKCTQQSRHYDQKKIKEYICLQKKIRHKKFLEEKEKKKSEEEKRRAKLLDLRSKSKELVEVSVKRRSAILKQQLEDLQQNALNVVGVMQPSTLIGITERSEVPSENLKNKVPTSAAGDLKILSGSHSDETAKNNVREKPVSHVGLQTGNSLVEPECEKVEIKLDLESDRLVSSLRLPSIISDNNQPLTNPDVAVQVDSLNEKCDSSKSGPYKVVLDKKICSSIEREMKKLAHNVYVLEKHKMIGVFPDRPLPHPNPMQRNEFETTERQASNLKNTNSSLWEREHQICAKNTVTPQLFQSNNLLPNISQNSDDNKGLAPIEHDLEEKPSNAKSTVINVTFENGNILRLPEWNASTIQMPQSNEVNKEKIIALKNNSQETKQNHGDSSSSMMCEGSLPGEDVTDAKGLKGAKLNNFCDTLHLKCPDSNKKEVPFWLQNLSIESRPFNFISAVKMKLNKFLEEQNKKNETPTNITHLLKPELAQVNLEELMLPSDDVRVDSGDKFGAVSIEQEVLYDSDFETSAKSSTLPNEGALEDEDAANSSDLDTATEDILPTDEVLKPAVSMPSPKDASKAHDELLLENTPEGKKSLSTTSIQSNYSHPDYKLVVPLISLSRSISSHTSKTVESSKTDSTRSLSSNSEKLSKLEDSGKEVVSSIPCEVSLKNKREQSSSGMLRKPKISVDSKPKQVKNEAVTALTESPESLKKSSVTTSRSSADEKSSPGIKEMISGNSSEVNLKFSSGGSHSSSIKEPVHPDGLYVPANAQLKLQTKNRKMAQEMDGIGHSPKLLNEESVSSEFSMKANDSHAEKLAEMERKAFEHRTEMERAFEKERLKLELALAEAKRTVFDSKLEASKFISDAAVELVKSQAEATKANAEATKHLSEAKVMSSLKLETISAQSASAAAFAAVQAAMKQLKGFTKGKNLSKKSGSSVSSEKSETSSVSSGETSDKASFSKASDGTYNVDQGMPKEITEIENKSESSVTEDLNVEENAINSENNDEKVVPKELSDYPEDSSLPSISENISEPEYSSKFDDTVSEIEVKIKHRPKEGDINAMKASELNKRGIAEHKKVISKKKQDGTVDKHNVDSPCEVQGILEYNEIHEESSNSDKDSFTKFSLSMFQQLMREEEMRAQHQQALLKLREDAIIDKTKAEMTLLELKKKQCRDKGQEDAVSSIRKKQRGLLIRLKQERDEIQRLKKSHKTASHERRMMLIQQQHIIKMRMSTKEIMNRLQTKKLPPTPKAIRSMGLIRSALDTSRSSIDVKTEESALGSRTQSNIAAEEPSPDATHSDASLATEPANSSHATASDLEGHKGGKCDTRVLEKQVIHGLNDLERNKKFLSEREKNLIHRRQAVEELLLWRKRLELEEERVRALESKALAINSQPSKPQTSFYGDQDFSGLKADRSTSPLHLDNTLQSSVNVKLREDAATSMADLSSAHSESILEDAPNQSQKSSLSVPDEIDCDSKKLDQFGSEMLPSQSSVSVINTQLSIEQQSKEEKYPSVKESLESEKECKSVTASVAPLSGKDDSKGSPLNITIKSPLTPYFVGRQKRRHSSGSDDSIILSQNETASEQSDIESKICALQEQLRRRKMEAELLRKEQKRCHRERLKAKEQSLIKQIQAYDLYIQRAHKELEQEYESPTTSLVKPQIKQHRHWKKEFEESKEVPMEMDKNSSLDSLSEVVEKVSLPESSTLEKGEKSPAVEDNVKAVALMESQNEGSKNIPVAISVNVNDSQTQNNSLASLTEVMEEIPALMEDLPMSGNSPLSLSRGSSLETTIESPTKHNNLADQINAGDDQIRDSGKSGELGDCNVLKASSGPDALEQHDLSKMIDDSKSDDKYDEDTFEHTSCAAMEMKDAAVENNGEIVHSPVSHISEETAEELSYSSANDQLDHLSAEVSGCAEMTPEKISTEKSTVGEKGKVMEMPDGNIEIPKFEQISDEPVSLPSYIFHESPYRQACLNETFVVSSASKEGMNYEEKAEEITEDIFKNLFEESIVEVEILRNKNSACTLELSDCSEKVAELSPLYKTQDYEEILEQKLQHQQSNNEGIKVVSVCCEEWRTISFTETEADDQKMVSHENLLCDSLMQSLLSDAIFELLEIGKGRQSLFTTQEDYVLLGSLHEEHENIPDGKQDSDIRKRVQQIMLESSLLQVSPREKSRPQDLMITTYDVLSPDSSSCNSPVMGHSEMESVFAQVEHASSKLSQKVEGGTAIQFVQVEHGGSLGASTSGGEPAGGENEAFSQEWFEEDFGLNSSLREVEEIQLQQLQIEREIEQLQLAQAKEQQQRNYPYNFYIREIPNKPPPPYTPPEETPRISASISGPVSPLGSLHDPSPRAAIPTEQDEVANFITSAAGEFYDYWNRGETLDSVEMPSPFTCVTSDEDEEIASERSAEGEVQKKSRQSYFQFLFDLCRQLVDETLDNTEGEKWVSVPTKFGSRKLKPTPPLPNKECFVEEVVKQGLMTLGFIQKETRDNIMFSWTLKKRDRIDEILIREVQEEDRYWTNFDEEEKYLKEQIAESLFELLLADTSKAVTEVYEGRALRVAGING